VQAALDAIKGGKWRADKTMSNLFDRGYLQNGATIDADWISQLLGQGWGGGVDQFWGRVNDNMNTGALPRDGGQQQGGGGPVPDNLVGAGGGGGGGWGAGKHVNNDPFGGQLGGYIQGLIEDLKGRHGFDQEVLDNLYNQADSTSKLRERDRLLRRGDDFAASGLFGSQGQGSGVKNRAMQDIEKQESNALQSANTDIGYANAQAAVQQVNQLLNALQMATGRELGLGNLDLGYGNLGLGYDQLAVSKELGLGNLDLGRGDLALQTALQEWLINSGLWSLF